MHSLDGTRTFAGLEHFTRIRATGPRSFHFTDINGIQRYGWYLLIVYSCIICPATLTTATGAMGSRSTAVELMKLVDSVSARLKVSRVSVTNVCLQ